MSIVDAACFLRESELVTYGYGPSGTLPFTKQSRFSPLNEGTTHQYDNNCVDAICFSQCIDHFFVAAMKWIVFGDDGDAIQM